MNIQKLQVNDPEYKTRGERETEELIHKYRVVARKRQIQLLKDELELYEPFCTQSYTDSERRKPLLKVMWSLVVEIIKSPRQLLP